MSDTPEYASNSPVEQSPDASPTGVAPKEQRTLGMLCHLLALAGIVVPFPGGNVLGPLILWLVKKEEMPFVNDQGKEAVNFQITVLIAALCCLPLFLIVIGFFLLLAVGITALVFTIIATIKASEGQYYRYPFALRLIK